MAETKAAKAHDEKAADLSAAIAVVNEVCDTEGLRGISDSDRLHAATNLVARS